MFARTYRYVRSVKNAEQDIIDLANRVRSLSQLLHGLGLVLSELEKETSETNFRLHHINSCQVTLVSIRSILEKHDPTTSSGQRIETPLLKKIKWPFSSSETKRLLTGVEQHKSTINAALSADGLSMTLKALSRQGDIVKEMNLRWAMQTHIDLGKQRQKGLGFFAKVDPAQIHSISLKLRLR